VEIVYGIGVFMGPMLVISSGRHHKGRSSRVAVERAMYSLSVVVRAILLCNLLAQLMGQPQKVMT
jgi:hypothetical protein